jgi:hypothetical protein
VSEQRDYKLIKVAAAVAALLLPALLLAWLLFGYTGDNFVSASGRVVDTQGRPVEGAAVALRDWFDEKLAEVRSRPDGSYSLFTSVGGVGAYRLELEISKGGYRSRAAPLPAGGGNLAVDIILEPSGADSKGRE